MRTNFLTKPVGIPVINGIGSYLSMVGMGMMLGMTMDATSPMIPILVFGGGALSMWPVDRDGKQKPWYANSRRMGGIGYISTGVIFALIPLIPDWFQQLQEHVDDKSSHLGKFVTEMRWIAAAFVFLGAYFVFTSVRPRTKRDQTELTAGQS